MDTPYGNKRFSDRLEKSRQLENSRVILTNVPELHRKACAHHLHRKRGLRGHERSL
jgi:hypothetical protein